MKEIRKIARCIRTLLEVDGIDVKIADVVKAIEGKDLSDVNRLKDEIEDDMMALADKDQEPASVRRENIATFVISNWDVIKDNTHIKNALFNAYSQGRYTKEQRAKMKQELLERCPDDEDDVGSLINNETELDF